MEVHFVHFTPHQPDYQETFETIWLIENYILNPCTSHSFCQAPGQVLRRNWCWNGQMALNGSQLQSY